MATAIDNRDRRRMPAPAVLELLEPPVGLGFDADELEELILAVDDRIDVTGDPSRRLTLGRARTRLEAELGRIIDLSIRAGNG